MKKNLLIIFISLFYFSCEKIPDNVINPVENGFTTEIISKPDTIKKADNTLEFSVKINSIQKVSKVWFDIYYVNKTYDKIEADILLTNSGNNVFNSNTNLPNDLLNGKYQIEIFAKDETNYSKQIGELSFIYDSGVINQPPVLSDLVMSDKIKRETNFTIELKVTDQDGVKDIQRVYFTLSDPDGIENVPLGLDFELKSTMPDNKTAIYTTTRSFSVNSKVGKWLFKFKALDKNGNSSELLTKNVDVE